LPRSLREKVRRRSVQADEDGLCGTNEVVFARRSASETPTTSTGSTASSPSQARGPKARAPECPLPLHRPTPWGPGAACRVRGGRPQQPSRDRETRLDRWRHPAPAISAPALPPGARWCSRTRVGRSPKLGEAYRRELISAASSSRLRSLLRRGPRLRSKLLRRGLRLRRGCHEARLEHSPVENPTPSDTHPGACDRSGSRVTGACDRNL
jgi:hypothetical protein